MPETWRPLNDATKAALAEMSDDPFTQAAIWRVYLNAPHLLDHHRVILRLSLAVATADPRED